MRSGHCEMVPRCTACRASLPGSTRLCTISWELSVPNSTCSCYQTFKPRRAASRRPDTTAILKQENKYEQKNKRKQMLSRCARDVQVRGESGHISSRSQQAAAATARHIRYVTHCCVAIATPSAHDAQTGNSQGHPVVLTIRMCRPGALSHWWPR